jgi:Ca2+-binding RTX toxin-like protein
MGGGMSLHLEGVYQTGADALDIGLSDSLVVANGAGTFVIMTSGIAGGLSVYRLEADGRLSPHDTQVFPSALQTGLGGTITFAEIDGAPVVFIGGDDNEAWGYAFEPDGQIGPLHSYDWATVQAAAATDAPGALQAWGQFSGVTGLAAQMPVPADNLVAVHNLGAAQTGYMLSLDRAAGQVFSHSFGSDGGYVQIAVLGAAEGLAISNPTAMEIANFGTNSFAIIASATGSSISVVEVGLDGSLTPVQQLIDTASTRFANVQDLTLVQDGDHVFVMAIGADHGVTVFRLLPDGHLVFLETFEDDLGGALDTPTTINAQFQNGILHAFIGTQDTAALLHLQSDQSNLGQVLSSSLQGADLLSGSNGDDILLAGSDADTLTGGAGHDILSSGPGHSTLTGGTGNDIFVIRAESTRVEITDFRPGQDRLDLTDLPMLRNLGQVEVATTTTGAVIRFRDMEIVITAHNSAMLSLADLFPDGLFGADSMLIIAGETDPVPPPDPPPDPPPPPGPPGVQMDGTNTHDSLLGGEGDDTLNGARGNDTIRGWDGNDLIDGGNGHDRLWGGAGQDTIYGGARNDMIGGGSGNDLLYGGTGNDSIYGGAGNDTIYGEQDDTRLWGMSGHDLIHGSTLGGRIGGGGGDDTVIGGSGNDTIYGGAVIGNDSIDGGSGDDMLWGMEGDDTLIGGLGDDFLGGALGNDRLHGGPGDDTVRGAEGADTFVFLDGDETLLIEDFSFADGDQLELDNTLWQAGLTLDQMLGIHGTVANGDIVLDFGDGDVITLAGLANIGLLADYITII